MAEKLCRIVASKVPESILNAARASAKLNDRSLSSELRRTICAAYSTQQPQAAQTR